jgi:multicomponent Na+:H+ antiporter subunit C
MTPGSLESAVLFALVGVALVGLGAHGVVAYANLVRKILALNVLGGGIFLVLVAMAARHAVADPVPHAMVLTGIVVAVSATAVALMLTVRVRAVCGRAELPTDHEEESPASEPPREAPSPS